MGTVRNVLSAAVLSLTSVLSSTSMSTSSSLSLLDVSIDDANSDKTSDTCTNVVTPPAAAWPLCKSFKVDVLIINK